MKTLLLLFGILFLVACIHDDVSVKKPNVLLILVDDMGFSDPGFMGSGIETPNILDVAGVEYPQEFDGVKKLRLIY